jgi:UDP-GlcNAc:undecaprenyl-phosphate GlcNAc-1-phosphate transferase
MFAVTAMPLCIRLARRYGLLDRPDEQRKMHAVSVPFTGGYGIIIAFAAAVGVMLLLEGVGFFAQQYPNFVPMYFYIGEATLIIVILGVIDDLRELTYSQKFFFQFIAAFLIILGAIKSGIFPSIFGIEDSSVLLNSVGMVVSLLWLVGTTNAINMIDGLDGLAGTTSLISAIALAVVAFVWGNPVIGFVLLTLSGAILGFLVFNTHPARVFMGDGGSMFIGFMLAFSGWLLVDSGPDDIIAAMVPILILGLPVADTLLAFFRRIMRGTNPFSADLLHIHHMVKARFDLSLSRAVGVLSLITLIYAAAGIAVAMLPPLWGWMLIAALVAGKLGFLHALGYTDLIRQRTVLTAGAAERQPQIAQITAQIPQKTFIAETSVRVNGTNGNGIQAGGVNGNGNGVHAKNGNGIHASGRNGNGIHPNGNGSHPRDPESQKKKDKGDQE